MSHLLTSGQVGNIGLNHMKAIRKETQAKWDSLGFLDGLKGHVKENIAQLYENQASTLLTESTSANSSGSFETVVFPIVRRVFSKLLANDIVSVQAMNMPIGKLFYFVPQTSSRVNGANPAVAGNNYNGVSSSDATYGTQYSAHTGLNGEHDGSSTSAAVPAIVSTNGVKLTQMQAKNLYDAFYNDGLFDNSKGTMTMKTYTVVNGNAQYLNADGSLTTLAPTATWPLATDGSVRTVLLNMSGFTTGGAGTNGREVLTGPDGNNMDTESFLASLHCVSTNAIKDSDGNTIIAAGSEVPFRIVTQQYGKGIVQSAGLVSTTGYMLVELDLRHPVGTSAAGAAATGVATYDGYVGASATTVSAITTTAGLVFGWAEYASLELETELGEVSFNLSEVVVAVEERKLRATWSPELAQDVSAFHNIDAEAELTAMLSEQVAAEIDREILRDLRKAAAWQLRWDYNGWRRASTSANPYTQKDWNQTLITRVNQLSAQIHKSTLRGGANFIVVSSEISAIFDDLEYFHVSDANPEQDQYNMGIERIGTLSGRYQVYRDPYAPAYSVVVGHKGKSLLDTGYIYAPYVPLQLTPTMYNPFNFAPVKGIMTRYAKKVVNNRFYGHVRVDGVPTFNVAELR
jgi:hypothetical protein